MALLCFYLQAGLTTPQLLARESRVLKMIPACHKECISAPAVSAFAFQGPECSLFDFF